MLSRIADKGATLWAPCMVAVHAPVPTMPRSSGCSSALSRCNKVSRHNKASRRNQGACMGRRPVVMRAAAATIPRDYGYFMASVTLVAVVYQIIVLKVAKARKEAGVEYPATVAQGNSEAAQRFNCAQRAHYNTVENLSIFLVCQLLLAQAHPLTAAALGVVWAVGRFVYAQGYCSGDPNKRLPGSLISVVAQLVTIGGVAGTAYKILKGSL